MASSIIGALRVTLGADTAQFSQGMDEARRKLSGMKSPLDQFKAGAAAIAPPAALATAAVAAFATGMQLAISALQNADALSASATKIGITAEALQALRFAGEDADIPIETLDSGLGSLNATLGALKSGIGDGKIRKAFEALGIPDSQLAGMRDASDLLPVLAEKIKGVGSQAEQVQIAKKLGVEDLLPLLQRGADGIEGLTDKARGLGLVMSEQVVTRLADMSREMEIADARAAMAGRTIGATLTPTLVGMKNALADGVTWLAKFIDQFNRVEDRAQETLKRQIDRARAGRDSMNRWGLLDRQDLADLNGQIATMEDAYLASQRRAGAEARSANRAKMRRDGVVTPSAGTSGGGSASSAGVSRAAVSPGAEGPDLLAQARQHRADLEARAAETARWFAGEVLDPATLQEPIAQGVAAGYAEGLDRSRDEIKEGYRGAIAGGLYSAIYGGGKGLMSYLADEFKRSMVEGLAEKLSSVLTGTAMGGGNSKGGAFLNFIGSIFGAGKNANGTANWRGGMTWVGERGPELVSLPGGTRITPNHALGGAAGGQMKISVVPSPYFDVRVAEVSAPIAGAASVQGAQLGSSDAQARVAASSRYRIAR